MGIEDEIIERRIRASEALLVERILPTLDKVQPNWSRAGWIFRCPLGHRKSRAKARIWVNALGWICVHCFDCGRDKDLRTAVVTLHL